MKGDMLDHPYLLIKLERSSTISKQHPAYFDLIHVCHNTTEEFGKRGQKRDNFNMWEQTGLFSVHYFISKLIRKLGLVVSFWIRIILCINYNVKKRNSPEPEKNNPSQIIVATIKT